VIKETKQALLRAITDTSSFIQLLVLVLLSINICCWLIFYLAIWACT